MNKNWCNAALVAYSALPKIVSEIDNGVLARVKSGYQSKNLQIGVSNEKLIGEIIQLNDEKRKMVNLRYIVSEALKRLKPEEEAILRRRLCMKLTFKEISEQYDIPLRTLFRRFADAERSFQAALYSKGYTEEWFEKEYGDDKYISAIYVRIQDENYFVAKSARG